VRSQVEGGSTSERGGTSVGDALVRSRQNTDDRTSKEERCRFEKRRPTEAWIQMSARNAPAARHVEPHCVLLLHLLSSRPVELCIDDVSKAYPDDTQALADISLRIGPGLLGLLCRNGTGKLTLMRLVATLTDPTTRGSVEWNRHHQAAESRTKRLDSRSVPKNRVRRF
jgi:ABC-type multidrug transport system fused ATPase/permease subunit